MNKFTSARKLTSFFYIFEYVLEISESQSEKKFIEDLLKDQQEPADDTQLQTYATMTPENIEQIEDTRKEEDLMSKGAKGNTEDEGEKSEEGLGEQPEIQIHPDGFSYSY